MSSDELLQATSAFINSRQPLSKPRSYDLNMKHRKHVFTVLLASVIVASVRQSSLAQDATAQTATGTVFVDANQNRIFDNGESPLAGVSVSNGRDVVATDADGKYSLPVDDDTIVFVTKPTGYRTVVDDLNLSRFYYIHKPNGSPPLDFPGVEPTGPLPERIDFPLTPAEEPTAFEVLFFGDPQPRDQKEIDYVAHDVVEDLVGFDAAFGVTLGDILFDDLSLFDSYNRTLGKIGIPWYNVIGNHDINFAAEQDELSDETYERVYGPAYYSFNYGGIHFLDGDLEGRRVGHLIGAAALKKANSLFNPQSHGKDNDD